VPFLAHTGLFAFDFAAETKANMAKTAGPKMSGMPFRHTITERLHLILNLGAAFLHVFDVLSLVEILHGRRN